MCRRFDWRQPSSLIYLGGICKDVANWPRLEQTLHWFILTLSHPHRSGLLTRGVPKSHLKRSSCMQPGWFVQGETKWTITGTKLTRGMSVSSELAHSAGKTFPALLLSSPKIINKLNCLQCEFFHQFSFRSPRLTLCCACSRINAYDSFLVEYYHISLWFC